MLTSLLVQDMLHWCWDSSSKSDNSQSDTNLTYQHPERQ